MEEDHLSLIYQTEQLINEQIELLETENSNLSEKVLLRETQINQTSSDLQDAYNRLIKQSQEECDLFLNEILNNPKKDFLKKSQTQLLDKYNHLQKNIDDETKKIKKAEMCLEVSEKYKLLFDKLISGLSNSISTNLSKINELSISSMNESIRKLNEECKCVNDDQYYQKKCTKLKNLENKNSRLSLECNQLIRIRNETKDRISQIANNLINISQKISISIQSKELMQLEKQNFDVMSIEPACQKRKMPVGNLLVLAPIHSLTRQMKGAQGTSRFFTKKNIF